MQIRDKPSLQWPKSIHALAEVRDKGKYCRFHQAHGIALTNVALTNADI